MEKSGIYKYCVEPFTEDCRGNLSWGHLGNILLQCASMHAGTHGFGYTQMIGMHHVWVLSRLVIEMDTLPRTGEDFTVETWVDRLYRQFTDRHFTIARPNGLPYGHATSTWSLIDTESRQPADLTVLADGGFTGALNADRHAPISNGGRIRLKTPEEVHRHRTAYTDLDINGHMNSIRYIELLLDQLHTAAADDRPVKRIEMAYCTEAYLNDELRIFQEPDANAQSRILFEITKTDGQVVIRGSIAR